MSVYQGWQQDLLSAASLPNTAKNRQFLSEWHNNATSDCNLNPVDISEPTTGSSDCKQVPGYSRHFQNYTRSSWTRTAFTGQLSSGNYPHLRRALRSGNPYTVDNPYDVEGDLNLWGSATFGAVYVGDIQAGGPPQKLKAPQALKGWADMQRSVNRHMPQSLRYSQRLRKKALRDLQRARRVRG